MAAESDEVASVSVSFEGDASGFEATLEEMQGDSEEAAEAIQSEFTEAFEEIQEEIEQTGAAIDDLNDKVAEPEANLTGDATENVEELDEDLDKMDGKVVEPEANLTGDASEKVTDIDTDLTNLDKKVSEPEANLTGDAVEKVDNIDTDLTNLDKKVSEPEANLTGDASEKVGDIDTDMDKLNTKTSEPTADLKGDAYEKVGDIDTDLDKLDTKKSEPEANLTGDASEKVGDIETDLTTLDGKEAEVEVNETGDADEKVGALTLAVGALTDDPHEIEVDAETADADTKLTAVKTLLESLRNKDITINVNQVGEAVPVEDTTKTAVTDAADEAIAEAVNDGVADVEVGAIDTDAAKNDTKTFMEGALGDILNDAGKDISSADLGSAKDSFITAATPGLIEAISSGILIPLGGAILGAAETAIGGGAWLVANLTGQNNPVAIATKKAITDALTNFDKQVTSTSADKGSLTALLGTVTASLNDLVPLATGFATGLTAICNALTPLFKSQEIKEAFAAIGGQIAASGKAAAPGISNFLKGILQLLNEAAPLISAVSTLIDQLMASFASKSTGKAEGNAFKAMATEMSANAPNISLLFSALVNVIKAVANAVKAFEAASLTALTGSLQAIANVLTALQPVFNSLGGFLNSISGIKGAGSEVADITEMIAVVGAWKLFVASVKALGEAGVKSIVSKMTSAIGGLFGSGKTSLPAVVSENTLALQENTAALKAGGGGGGLGGKGEKGVAGDVETGVKDAAPTVSAAVGAEVAENMAPVVLKSTGAVLAGVAWAAALVSMPADLVLILGAITRTNPESKTNVAGTTPTGLYGTKSQQAAYELALKQAADTGKYAEGQSKQLTQQELHNVKAIATDYATEGKKAAQNYATGYVSTMESSLAAMGLTSTKAADAITKAFDKGLGNASPSTISKLSGQNFMLGFENGINDSSIRTNINNSVKTLASNMVGNMRGYDPQFNQVGLEFMQALAMGITSGQSAVTNAVQNALNAAIASAQSTINTNMQKAVTTALNGMSAATRGI